MSSLTTKNKYLTTTNAAQFFNVTRFTVLNWIKQGKLKAVRTPGGHQRIPRENITSLIQRNRITPPPDSPK
jgi:excisionase family DNA binding protein